MYSCHSHIVRFHHLAADLLCYYPGFLSNWNVGGSRRYYSYTPVAPGSISLLENRYPRFFLIETFTPLLQLLGKRRTNPRYDDGTGPLIDTSSYFYHIILTLPLCKNNLRYPPSLLPVQIELCLLTDAYIPSDELVSLLKRDPPLLIVLQNFPQGSPH